MIDNIKISIITVCYNSVHTIERTIQSVLHQSYKNIEYIVIDGGSVDGTIDIIKRYADRITFWVSESDNGIYDAMNKGIQCATGDYIGVLNSDDWCDEIFIEKIVGLAEDCPNVGVIASQGLFFQGDKVVGGTEYGAIDTIWRQMPFAHPATYIKRDIYSTYGLYDTSYKIAADYELMLRLYVAGVSFKIVNEVWLNLSVGGVSTTNHVKTAMESADIRLKYSSYFTDYSEIKKWNQESTINAYVEELFLIAPKTIADLLEEIGFNRFAVFGCGNWGRKIIEIIVGTEMIIDEVYDNSPRKIGTDFWGYKVKQSGELSEKEGNVLIAVSRDAELIMNQLHSFGNKSLKIVSMMDLINGNMELIQRILNDRQ